MAETQIQRMSPRHGEILHAIVANPSAKRKDLARMLGVSQAWLSVVTNSDAFKAELSRMQQEVETSVVVGLRDRVHALAHSALDRLQDKVETEEDTEVLLEIATAMLDRAGVGKAPSVLAFQQNNLQVAGDLITSAREKVLQGIARNHGTTAPATQELPAIEADQTSRIVGEDSGVRDWEEAAEGEEG